MGGPFNFASSAGAPRRQAWGCRRRGWSLWPVYLPPHRGQLAAAATARSKALPSSCGHRGRVSWTGHRAAGSRHRWFSCSRLFRSRNKPARPAGPFLSPVYSRPISLCLKPVSCGLRFGIDLPVCWVAWNAASHAWTSLHPVVTPAFQGLASPGCTRKVRTGKGAGPGETCRCCLVPRSWPWGSAEPGREGPRPHLRVSSGSSHQGSRNSRRRCWVLRYPLGVTRGGVSPALLASFPVTPLHR